MKIGQVINGYQVIGVEGKNFSTKGGGLSMWTFVRKEGIEYFMKEFLTPTYPMENSLGSTELKIKKKTECEKFEQHHKELISKVIKSVSIGGNLIFTKDFFRYNTKYYKVTEKVDVASINISEITKLSLVIKLLVLKTVSHSLDILHKLNIVHGDLKPNNILIKKADKGFYTSKLIDFDNSYFEGQPPKNKDEVVGDPVYYSPELENYILSREDVKGSDLTCKSDVFALGVVFCQYLTGELPKGVSAEEYPSNIVNNGALITINSEGSGLPEELINLVNSMLLLKAKDRPTVSIVFTTLKKIAAEFKVSMSDIVEIDPISILPKTDTTILKKKIPERNTIELTPRLKISMGYKKKS